MLRNTKATVFDSFNYSTMCTSIDDTSGFWANWAILVVIVRTTVSTEY